MHVWWYGSKHSNQSLIWSIYPLSVRWLQDYITGYTYTVFNNIGYLVSLKLSGITQKKSTATKTEFCILLSLFWWLHDYGQWLSFLSWWYFLLKLSKRKEPSWNLEFLSVIFITLERTPLVLHLGNDYSNVNLGSLQNTSRDKIMS